MSRTSNKPRARAVAERTFSSASRKQKRPLTAPAQISVGLDGRVARPSPVIWRWLKEFFEPWVNGDHHLPAELDLWVREQRRLLEKRPARPPAVLQLKRPGARLTVRLKRTAPEQSTLLLVREATTNGRRHWSGLTPREVEVLTWIAEGKSNPEIAMILAISPRTVHKHVQHLLRKLEVPNRASALLRVLDLRQQRKRACFESMVSDQPPGRARLSG